MFSATASGPVVQGQIITVITIAYIRFMPVLLKYCTKYFMNIFFNSHNNDKKS